MVTVHKFGGGVLRSADDYYRAASILKSYGNGQVAVVSAIYGVTDGLDYALAHTKENHVDAFTNDLLKKHTELLKSLESPGAKKAAEHHLLQLGQRLNRILYGVHVLDEVTPRSRDLVLSFGERLSTVVLDAFLKSMDVPSQAFMADEAGLATTSRFGNAIPLWHECDHNLNKSLGPASENGVCVFTGFFGKSPQSAVTTLGRGGSDFSAGIVAHALDAEKLLIWKDVEGFMTADPKYVPEARFLEHLSYSEAEELGSFGAKILHPKTITPLRWKNIPAEVKNVHDPQKPGTRIDADGQVGQNVAKSVAFKSDCVLVVLKGASLANLSTMAYPLFNQLDREDVPIDSVSSSQADLSLCFERKYLPRVLEAVHASGTPHAHLSLEEDSALIGLIGEGMKNSIGTSSRLFAALAATGVNVRLICQGASEINITVAIASADLEKALKAMHAEFIGKT